MPTSPAASAGATSLSTRSPTYAIFSGAAQTARTMRAKKAGSGLATPQLSDEPSTSTHRPSSSSTNCGVLPTAHTVTPVAQPRHAGQRVRVPVVVRPRRGGMLHPEGLPYLVVVASAGGQPAEHAHQRERRHAGDLGGPRPHPRLVDQRLADVEDDDLYSHAATRSRSARVVTL